MRKVSAFVALITLLFVAMPLHAQSFVISCKARPNSISSVKRALEAKLATLVDTNQFDRAKATARLVLLNSTLQNQQVSVDQLLAGIDIHDSADPSGLAFGVGGAINIGQSASCVYNYRVIIVTRGTDKATGQKLSTRTESSLSITAPPSGTIKRVS